MPVLDFKDKVTLWALDLLNLMAWIHARVKREKKTPLEVNV